ncbi:DgyrCDS9501 [Dimorphilus gyrociliatus]|uniref:DgyrCDS9501 n=1 Tax=Dimorphilus gyrociliatus TaxID=2664684 RepID=A0A7I8VXJ1_9ANNE|nr:DgyrCDS9501 [Dimorphilus gyrociliatus]
MFQHMRNYNGKEIKAYEINHNITQEEQTANYKINSLLWFFMSNDHGCKFINNATFVNMLFALDIDCNLENLQAQLINRSQDLINRFISHVGTSLQNADTHSINVYQGQDSKVCVTINYFSENRKHSILIHEGREEIDCLQKLDEKLLFSDNTNIIMVKDLRLNPLHYTLNDKIPVIASLSEVITAGCLELYKDPLFQSTLIDDRQINILRDLHNRIFHTLTGTVKLIAENGYLSLYIPIWEDAQNILRQNSNPLASKLLDILISKLTRWNMKDLRKIKFLCVATFLDPRFRETSFSKEEIRRVKLSLSILTRKIYESRRSRGEIHPCRSEISPVEYQAYINDRIKCYMAMPYVQSDADPIQWWNNKKEELGDLYYSAIQVLTADNTNFLDTKDINAVDTNEIAVDFQTGTENFLRLLELNRELKEIVH